MAEQAGSQKATNGVTTNGYGGTRFTKEMLGFVMAGVLLVQAAGVRADLPGFRAPLLDTPATPSDFRSGASLTPYSAGASASDAEIQELARALKYDPGLMYKYVHDYIKFYPIWGDLKGPYMTWMDRSGNGFDQASLMIALLEEAQEHGTQYTVADPNYVVGEIQLTSGQASDWLYTPGDPNGARAVLARAGLYATVTENGQGGISNIKLEHVWVKVKIDGDTYEFDPSFKDHVYNSGLDWLNYGIGYTQANFLSNAEQGSSSGTDWVKDLNKTNIRNLLDTYADHLVEYIRDNVSDGGLADVICGRTITPADANALPPSSLPYTVQSRDYEFDRAHTPNMYRTSLRIQHSGIDQSFWSSDIYGRRLTLRYNGSNQPQILLDGTVKATGNATTPGQQYDLTLTVAHPYESTDFDGTVTTKVTSGGFYHIVNGWGDTDTRIIEAHRGKLEQYLYDGYSNSSEEVLGESFSLVGLTWLAQTSKMRALTITKAGDRPTLTNHHMLGVAGQYGTPYIDIPLGHLGVYHDDEYSDPNGTFLMVAGHAAAYEHEVIRQLQDCNSVSAINLLEQANDRSTYDKIYYANSSNWSSVQSNLQSYSQAEKDLVSSYISAGFTVRLPQYGDLSQDDWTGIGFQAVLANSEEMAVSYVISGGYSGGAGAGNNDALSPSELFDRGDVFAGEREGTYHHDSTDMTIGAGGMPFGLALSRSYSSDRRLKDGPLGLGWTHNFDITAAVRSDSFQALGADSPTDAAPHIVALFVTSDILTNDSNALSENVIASLCQSWLMDRMMNNLVTLEQGGGKMQFVKVPDANDPNGFYNPPERKALKLVPLAGGSFRLKNPGGIFNDFDSSGRITEWSNAHGSKTSFTYSSGKLSGVASKIDGSTTSWSLSFIYTGDRITRVNDSASRSIYYTYDGDGNLEKYTNPDSKDTTYDYHATNDGQLIKVFSPLSTVDPVLTNVYDTLGRLQQQIGANDDDYAMDYYLAGYRAETVEPNQTDPNDVTQRFSMVVWADERGRPISATDQLGRESTYEYDGKLRLIKSTSAYGTSSEFDYDQYHRPTRKDSKVKPGSSDPNIYVTFDFDSYENGDGRWFGYQDQATDPNGYSVYYYYDYNDVGTYGTAVGNLRKIRYPTVEAGTATVEFEYNAYGQLRKKIDPSGVVTEYQYNTVANRSTLKKVIVDANDAGALAITTEYTYDSVGNVATAKDPRGNTTTYEYHNSRLLKKVTAPSPLSYATEYEYYDDGRLRHVKQNTPEDGWIYHQSLTYTPRGQTETVRGPYKSGQDSGINLTTYDYDDLGRVWKITDALGNITETRYYPDSRVWRVIDAEDHNNVTNTYDANGYLVKVEDAKGNATQYEYNGFGGLKKTIYPDGTYTEPNYSPIRESRSIRTRAGDIIETWFDDLNRLKQKVTPEMILKYRYDLRGRMIETYRQKGGAKADLIKYTYDDVGRVTKVEYADDKELSYEYDAGSNRTKLTYPDGTYITYEYDALSRLTKIKNQGGTTLAEYTYDSRSRRTDLEYANGTGIDYTYDAANRLTTIENTTETGSHKHAYTYDKVGNRLTMLVNDTDQHSYTYDDIYQITDVNYPASYSWLSDTTFSYDDAGNRTSVVDGGTTNYAANMLNQYNSVGSVSYDYDGNGNTTFDGVAYYSYDSENRLTGAINAEGSTAGPFNAAVDNMDLAFTTGGDANWAPVQPDCNDPAYGGPDSAKSGTIGANQQSWLQTTLYGPGTLTYYRKLADGTDDVLRTKMDGVNQSAYYNAQDWTKGTVFVGAGMHTYQWHYSKGASGTTADGGVWIDWMQWQYTGSTSTLLQQALDAGWTVITDGDADWEKQSWGYYGSDCAQSGEIEDGQTSDMAATVEGAGTVSFYWKVSSEEDRDYLKFYLDGVYKDQISGEVGWQQKSYAVGSGTHSLVWKYVKNGDETESDDCGWVDYLQGPGTTPPVPDLLAQALDCELTFTTGGDSGAKWGTQDWLPYYGPDMAESGSVSNSQQVWMQTSVTVNDGDKMSFYWKVSSEASQDYLQFYIDTTLKDQISGNVDWQKKSYTFSGSGTKTLKWRYVKDSSGSEGQDRGWVDGLAVGTESLVGQPDAYSEALDCDLKFTSSEPYNTWWAKVPPFYCEEYYLNGDSAESYDCVGDDEESCLQTIVESDSAETVKFYWKVSSQSGGDYLQFYIDSTLKDQISGEVGWQQKSYPVDPGTHILKWRYVKNSNGEDGDDTAWVDFVQWSGPSPAQDPADWQEIAYKHDVTGRRVEKKVDGYSTRYVYDGPHVIAEYDGNNNLLRKYIYGPCIDEPICMIEVADSNATYYYHYDALGSVVALSDSNGDTVQTYEYSVYGEVAVEDANHPNPYMFAGVRYDIEIGLYYNRARYYNPFTGRFLQADPIADGMNLYAYCGNDPTSRADPSGLSYRFLTEDERVALGEQYRYRMVFADLIEGTDACILWDGNDISEWIDWAPGYFGTDWAKDQPGWILAGQGIDKTREWWFWRIKAIMYLDEIQRPDERNVTTMAEMVAKFEEKIAKGEFSLTLLTSSENSYLPTGDHSGTLKWNPGTTELYPAEPRKEWFRVHPLALLAHELGHAFDASICGIIGVAQPEVYGVIVENRIREGLFRADPTQYNLYPRPGYTSRHADLDSFSAERAWKRYIIKGRGRSVVY